MRELNGALLGGTYARPLKLFGNEFDNGAKNGRLFWIFPGPICWNVSDEIPDPLARTFPWPNPWTVSEETAAENGPLTWLNCFVTSDEFGPECGSFLAWRFSGANRTDVNGFNGDLLVWSVVRGTIGLQLVLCNVEKMLPKCLLKKTHRIGSISSSSVTGW